MATQRRSDEGRTEHESSTQAGATSSSASETAGRATDRVQSGAAQVGQQAKEQANRLSEQTREQISSQAEQQKERATNQLRDIGSALHETSSTLRDREQDSVARVMEGAANQVERFSGYLREHSVDEMISEVEYYARREPELFLGGAMLLGLVGARFFKSSSPERHHREHRGRGRPRGVYSSREPARRREERREERDRPTVAGTSGAEMPDPSRTESAETRPGTA